MLEANQGEGETPDLMGRAAGGSGAPERQEATPASSPPHRLSVLGRPKDRDISFHFGIVIIPVLGETESQSA